MNDKEFMSQKASEMSIDELAKAINIKSIEVSQKKECRFAKVEFSDRKDILLTSGHYRLIETWLSEDYLNNFRNFDSKDRGHAWIRGTVFPFEIIDSDGKVLLTSNEVTMVRFLKKGSD